MDILVIGGSGLLGRRITHRGRLAGHRVTATFHAATPPADGADWRQLDIRRRADVTALTAAVQPDAVINAAYRKSGWETTADGAAHVALASAAAGARLVHVSSDAVFSGSAPSYNEESRPDPVTPYGAAKAAAETAVKAIAPAAAIARTSLIIGDGDSPHEKLVHALASGSTPGVLFTDEVRCPVHADDLAGALLELAAASHTGVCHTAGADADSGLPGATDVRLDCTRTQARLTTRLRGAREFLAPGPTSRGADDLS